ncbi:hypothetical protein [Candidatus Albibeggiatoa sp. nov. NOAA]|uniref:hypothetical protein n=1 Tax=Candidatus Albibeggiatoa sp. nov. NOAA TaxID=3162724 RepID=UPI0032F90A35|nr:hypothetical protein [Thiotrichaceae bacterium]
MLLEKRVVNQSRCFNSNHLTDFSKEEKLKDKQETVKSMLLDGMSITLTAKITQLPIEQIEQIKKNIVN